MGLVSASNTLGWTQTSIECEDESLTGYSGNIRSYYEIDQSGAGAKLGSPMLASFSMGDIINIGCGTASLIFSDQIGYDIPQHVVGDLDQDSGRISTNYEESFSIENLVGEYESANGLYKLTTFFKNNKPTYFNQLGWWVWWNGTSWSLSDTISNPSKELKNQDDNPLGGIWDCDPSCQQKGVGPESPELSCIPSSHDTIEFLDSSQIVENFGTISFNDEGKFGISKADFSETQGLPRLLTVNAPDGFTLVDMTLQAWPSNDSSPKVYFECTSSFCDGECYGGDVTKISGTDNWQANLSLLN